MASELAIEIATLQGWIGINTGSPGAIGHYGIHPQIKIKDRVPEPDVDPAACLELLRYVADEQGLSVYIAKANQNWICQITPPKTLEPLERFGDTLELALATAARDALTAIREEEQETA